MTRDAEIPPSDRSRNSASRSPLNWLGGAVRNKPEALLLLAAGCALLVSAGRSVASKARPHGEPRQSTSPGDPWSGLDAEQKDGAANAGGRIADERRSMSGGSSQQSNRPRSAIEAGLNYLIYEQPLILAALGLAAGATFGAALPTTEIENRTLGGAHDQLAQAAADRVTRLRATAEDVGAKVKEAAVRHGFTSDNVRDFAREVTEAVSTAANADLNLSKEPRSPQSRSLPSEAPTRVERAQPGP